MGALILMTVAQAAEKLGLPEKALARAALDHGYFVQVGQYSRIIESHTGTHIDAPLQYSADGNSLDEIPVEILIVPLCVIHIHEKSATSADAQVTPEDLKAWISRNGPIPDNACVAMHSGWENKVSGDGFCNADSEGVMHFPGFHIDAANMLLEEAKAAAIAVDTLSLDFGKIADFATHYAWLPCGRLGIENLMNLAKVPESGTALMVGVPKHRGDSGDPSRIFTMA